MRENLISKRRLSVFINDIVMVVLAWISTFLLSFNLEPPFFIVTFFLPYIVFVQACAFYACGLYRGIWRFASIPDLIRILKAVAIGVMSICFLFIFQKYTLFLFPIPIIYGLLLLLFLSAPRITVRWYRDYTRKHSGEPILVIGAGRAGESIVRDLTRLQLRGYKPIAFVDDDPKKIGQDVHGIRVRGSCELIPKLVEQLKIKLCLIAMPSATSQQMRRIVMFCEQAKVAYRTLPSLKELAEGRVSIQTVREVSLGDLLGREEVNLAAENISNFIRNKVIVVTGAGGSIGSELCIQLARLMPKKIIIIDNSEFNLYSIDLKLKNEFPSLDFDAYLVSITDRMAIEKIFDLKQPDLVFHAAAYKHVPLLESQLYNNVIGTRVVAEAAVKCNCSTFVLISTDKAVNPTNVMGASKRAAEVFCQSYAENYHTKFITVRFGNVLDSAGSVIPLFRKQLKSGGPITVTHPDITRFFMTIPEASQLIIQASNLGVGGEIFVLDMGDPIKISYLAEQLIKFSGKTLKDINIEYTGLRAGEKLHEELFYSQEELKLTAHPKIRQAQSQKREWLLLLKLINEMEKAYEAYDVEKLFDLLLLLTPEYQPKEQQENPQLLMNYSQ